VQGGYRGCVLEETEILAQSRPTSTAAATTRHSVNLFAYDARSLALGVSRWLMFRTGAE
jgi:hypothetical protein